MIIDMTCARVMMVVLLGGLLLGCWRASSPDDRARHFIESQVTADTPIAATGGDLAGRVAFDYARALVRQGAALRYRIEAGAAGDGPTSAVIAVTPRLADGTVAAPLRFRVVLAKDDAGDWQVTAWSAAE